jgi:hypothetical protein
VQNVAHRSGNNTAPNINIAKLGIE